MKEMNLWFGSYVQPPETGMFFGHQTFRPIYGKVLRNIFRAKFIDLFLVLCEMFDVTNCPDNGKNRKESAPKISLLKQPLGPFTYPNVPAISVLLLLLLLLSQIAAGRICFRFYLVQYLLVARAQYCPSPMPECPCRRRNLLRCSD